MKSLLFSLVMVMILAVLAFVTVDQIKSAVKGAAYRVNSVVTNWMSDVGLTAHFVTLNKSYGGYPSGATVELPKSTEDTLVANGGAVTSAGPATSGPISTFQPGGSATIPAGSSSVVVTNPLISAQSLVWAVVAQAAADGTLLRVERIVAADGLVTIYGTANATAATRIDWAILNPYGNLSNPS